MINSIMTSNITLGFLFTSNIILAFLNFFCGDSLFSVFVGCSNVFCAGLLFYIWKRA
jgi:hypothetical protein